MPTTTTTDRKLRTITLSGRSPVTIADEEWPTIAQAGWHDGQVRSQANRERFLRVRRHTDGRTLVYGGYDTQFQGERGVRAGELLDAGDDVPAAIQRIAARIGDADLGDECIADLPPVAI